MGEGSYIHLLKASSSLNSPVVVHFIHVNILLWGGRSHGVRGNLTCNNLTNLFTNAHSQVMKTAYRSCKETHDIIQLSYEFLTFTNFIKSLIEILQFFIKCRVVIVI